MTHLGGEQRLLGDAVGGRSQVGGGSHEFHGQIVLLVEDGRADLGGAPLQVLPDGLQEHLRTGGSA